MTYHALHSNPGLNFTLNRIAQTVPPEEVRSVAAQIDSLESWIAQMQAAGERAEQEGRLADAARYFQGAEFYMKQGDAGKAEIYVRYRRWPRQERVFLIYQGACRLFACLQ